MRLPSSPTLRFGRRGSVDAAAVARTVCAPSRVVEIRRWRREGFRTSLLSESRAVIVSSESSRRDVLDFYRLPPETLHVVPLAELKKYAFRLQ